MDFSGRFKDHIMPEKIHALNVSFFLDTLRQSWGGTAGNIAYSLSLLECQPAICATAGHDFAPYRQWLEQHHVDVSRVREIAEEPTAVAYIFTDQDDNQITGFYPGAMKYAAAEKFQIPKIKLPTNPKSEISNFKPSPPHSVPYTLAIVSPGNVDDMRALPEMYYEKNIPYIYDPGQAITGLSGEDLKAGIIGARYVICNDYEMSLIEKKTGLREQEILEYTEAVIVTLGAQGSRLITAQGAVSIPAGKPEHEIDPTGAGDAFRAGFIAGLQWGWPLEQACKLGATVSLYTVEKKGTQTHTFTLADVRARFEKNYGAWSE